MKLKHILISDATLSMALHMMKALLALLVNWLVLHHFSVGDFVIWSVTSSVLVVATASDLGIGQYVVTRLIHSDQRHWPSVVGEGLGALLPLSLLAALFVCLAIGGGGVAYTVAMALFLALRVTTIPFAAALNAVNQFKIRKAIEFAAYSLAALLIGTVIWLNGSIYIALAALNATFLLAAIATMVAALRYIPNWQRIRPAPLRRTFEVFHAATPFMANNLTGLLTYGGFIWLSSLILPDAEVAKLAVLHSFVLMNLYQVYDVLLKARQADLANKDNLAPYRRLNLLFMCSLPIAFAAFGREALSLLSRNVGIGLLDTTLFGVFMSLEMGNLFVQSVAQVTIGQVHRLKIYALIRSAMLAAFLIAGAVPLNGHGKLIVLLAGLSLGSFLAFVYLRRTRAEGRGDHLIEKDKMAENMPVGS